MCNYSNSDGYCLLTGNECFSVNFKNCNEFLTYRRDKNMTCGTCEFWFEGLCNDGEGDYEEVPSEFSCNNWLDKKRIDALRDMLFKK